MGDPTVTVCSNGLETIGSVKQQRCGCCASEEEEEEEDAEEE
jgi:hypothetical protein